MSEYTTRQVLDMIEANGGPEGLDLSGKDLEEIDLSLETIEAELHRVRDENPEAEPLWWIPGPESSAERGVNLQGAKLEEVHLQGANLWGANLEAANLMMARLAEADLWEAHLEGADLRGANLEGAFLGGANLEGANLGYAHLEAANLRYANLEGANLGAGDLEGAVLTRANLQGAYLGAANLQEAYVVGTNLKGANVSGANLKGACLSHAHLAGADLAAADLSRIDFRDVESIKAVWLWRALLDHTQLARDQLGGAIAEELDGNWPKAKESYLALKTNFEQIGRYDDASWAYRKERRMEKREAWQKAKEAFRKHHWRAAAGNGLKAASDQLVELVCDYGEGIWRVIGSLLVLWLALAVLYGAIWGVWGPWQKTATGQIRYVTRNPVDLLLFSIGVTSRMPAGLEARSVLAMRVLMAIEAVLGTVLAGLLGFVLGNRIRRS